MPHKWCIWTDQPEYQYKAADGTMAKTASWAAEPSFARTVRIRQTDIHPGEQYPLLRIVSQTFGFDQIEWHYRLIEGWRGDECFYAAMSEKAWTFMEQCEEFHASKRNVVNTLTEHFSFHKNIIHRGPHCICKDEMAPLRDAISQERRELFTAVGS